MEAELLEIAKSSNEFLKVIMVADSVSMLLLIWISIGIVYIFNRCQEEIIMKPAARVHRVGFHHVSHPSFFSSPWSPLLKKEVDYGNSR